ncbi:hypothetical protein [Streptomyces sp. NL15-2K]|uniref:hypothetical protein n=1 Tax=Streptomyces sp. NL15-2K TaxID=376149 RepID=UPI000F578891|nr:MULTISPECIES: hypothetical protein [Actinomycetes]WKX10902.1 hypothetical protein Q4V64_26715 [Kutzneria buriramensis]GCB47535.1 hypothetical protein SNL152K_4840 [Streptomyces sp. NL15-2K]
MKKTSRIATVTLLALGGLSLPAYSASAAAAPADPARGGGLLQNIAGPIKPYATPLVDQLPYININNLGRPL